MQTKNTACFILFTLTLPAMPLSACSAPPAIGGDNSNGNGSPVTPIIVDNGNNSNSNDVNSNDANSNDNAGNAGNSNDSGVEIVSVVEAITDDTITINEVTYQLVSFTEFQALVSVGDQVKFQVIFNTDGTFTILHIEIFAGDDNSKTNYPSADADITPSVLWTSLRSTPLGASQIRDRNLA